MCASIDKYLGCEAHVNVTLIMCLHSPGSGIAGLMYHQLLSFLPSEKESSILIKSLIPCRVSVGLEILKECSSALMDAKSRSHVRHMTCLLYTSPSPRDRTRSRMPSSA